VANPSWPISALARHATDDASLTQSGQALGTPHYMAPEQVRGEAASLDIRTDLYSLGATLFHLVTGQPPYEGGTGPVVMAKHLHEPAPQAHKVNPKVSEATSRMIQRLMQKKKEDRFQTPTDVVRHIEKILSGQLTGPQKASRTTVPRLTVKDRPEQAEAVAGKKPSVGLYAGMAVAVLVLAGIGYAIIGKATDRVPAEKAQPGPPVATPAKAAREAQRNRSGGSARRTRRAADRGAGVREGQP